MQAMNNRLARSICALWVLALLASLGVLFGALPGYFTRLAVDDPVADGSTMMLARTWLPISLNLTAALISLVLACVLVWKKANDAMALFLSFFLLLYGIILASPLESFADYWFPQHPDLGSQLENILFPAPLLVLILLLIFPNGSFIPRWTICLPLLAGLLTLLSWTYGLEESASLTTLRARLTYGALVLLCFFALGIQAHRYRTLYTSVERQQTKWVAYGTLLWLAFGLLSGIQYYNVLNQPATAPEPVWSPVAEITWPLFLNILPISLTLAILRSHLWDIDIIIRRTLVYSLLTFTLGLIYLGCILMTRMLVAPLTGGSELAIVISTLTIAALFLPLRRRIQRTIDKRFYRRKYDAAKVLAAFGVMVRDETDLNAVSAELLKVVEETMQPEFVGLWLRDTQARSTTEAARPDSRPLR
jgi:hypothetical protein